VTEIERVMWAANERMQSLKKSGKTVVSLVPRHLLDDDKAFIEYVRKSNDDLGMKQATGLAKIKAFCLDTTLFEARQADMKKECLARWQVSWELSSLVSKY
jgi:cap1 methyltransferase